MKKKIIICVVCFLVLLVCWIFWYFLLGNKTTRKSDWDLHVLTSIDDKVVGDSMWCGTFQLVWNDMVNEVVKKDVEFNPQLKIVENLNKQTFTNKQLSPSSYYSIENGIKDKFDETSVILDQWADWNNIPQSDDYYDWKDEKKYWFYAMLKKIFKFKNIFDQLDNWKFANKYNNIKYFWIDEDSSSKLYKQVYVYYYNSDSDFAVALKTNEWEEVILARWIWWNSFMDIYGNILRNEEKYQWKHYFTENDYLKVPELNLKNLTEFDELENKEFPLAEPNRTWKIDKALQTIELKLDKEWWEIKSEAWIAMTVSKESMPMGKPKIEYRYFYFNKPYVMFLKEADKDLPYFAAQISDITLFQK